MAKTPYHNFVSNPGNELYSGTLGIGPSDEERFTNDGPNGAISQIDFYRKDVYIGSIELTYAGDALVMKKAMWDDTLEIAGYEKPSDADRHQGRR